MSRDVDLITLEVIQQFLISTVREMRATMIRTAHSSIIYESHDFSCAILNAEGQLVAQSEDSPVHVIPLPWQVHEAIEFFRADFTPGDVVLVNDPYTSGTHLNDVVMFVPFFCNGRLVAFAATRAHWGDVGGMFPGSISGKATEIFQEGLRIPFLKVYRAGTVVPGILDLLFANMRVPDEREGDFHAMLACCHVGERRLAELVDRFGSAQVQASVRRLLDRAEARMRQAVAGLATGTYHYEDYLDSDNVSGLPVLLRVAVTASGEHLTVDFAGSSAQVKGPVNCSLAVTATGTFVALKALLDSGAPINHGTFRPITVQAPEGSIVNARYPAATGGFTEMRRRVESAVMGALSQAAPQYVSGDIKGTSNHTYIGSVHPVKKRVTIFYEYPAGGTGAFLEHDGSNAMRAYDEGDFSSIQPIEAVEHEHAVLVERCELRVDSCGDGRRRGGLGLRREIRLLASEGTFSELSDRNIIAPYGVCGGYASSPNRFVVRRGGAEIAPSDVPGKVSGFRLQKDDVVVMETAGGGGYGLPIDREISLVDHDVREGYITRRRAEERYGVVFGSDGIDGSRTEEFRCRARSAVHELVVVEHETDDFTNGRRVCLLSKTTAKFVGVSDGDLVELVNPRGAPLRAWAVVSDHVREGCVHLGPVGLNILGLREAGRVEIRKC